MPEKQTRTHQTIYKMFDGYGYKPIYGIVCKDDFRYEFLGRERGVGA